MKIKGILFGLFIGIFNFISIITYKFVAIRLFDRNINITTFDTFCISLIVAVIWTIIIIGVISRKKM